MASFEAQFSNNPFLAILRGVNPDEVIEVATILQQCGIEAVEVTLNSPDALTSIRLLADQFGKDMLIGAGTVLEAQEVQAVADAGGTVIVSPNCDTDVIKATRDADLTSVPGTFTPTEAFTALKAGAHALKYFPANLCGPSAIGAWKAVLPKHVPIIATGGIGPGNVADWLQAGCLALGTGSILYKPGIAHEQLRAGAIAYQRAYQDYKDARD